MSSARTRAALCWFLLCGGAHGCGSRIAVDDPTEGDTDVEPCSESDCGGNSIQLVVNRDVDILFVVDNSGSMGEAQGRLAASIPAFMSELEAPDGAASVRVGVTTTDNGNPWCATTSPEGGNLQLQSCRSRLGEFVFAGDPPADATAVACTDVCAHETIDVIPTTTSFDSIPRARPWLEVVGGRTNIAGDVTFTEALQCTLPQGIAGCGYESPLESMYKTILRSQSDGEDESGFLRPSAIAAIVIVSDEVDCSYNDEFESIFLPAADGGTPIFWSDPEASAPTSAVCWNAGVVCEGSGAPYESCRAANKNTAGFVDIPDADAVLHPPSRYIDLLEEVEVGKQQLTPAQEVIVAGLLGVPIGYDGDLVYENALDPIEQNDFGIGAGCVSDDGDPATPPIAARPPVRMREVADAFDVADVTNIHSICEDEYAGPLGAIARAIRDQIRPSCMTVCVADTDPIEGGVQPECTLIQEAPDVASGSVLETVVPRCLDSGTLPAGEPVCWFARSGDALSQACADEGWNLEFAIARADGMPAPDGTSMSVRCELSQNKAIDCPLLP